MLPVFNPLVLIFDLDETTHTIYKTTSINLYPIYVSPDLSLSAKNLLCCEPNRKYKWFSNFDPDKGHENTYTLQPIAPDEFKKIFNKIYSIRKKYKDQCPVAVKIMTRGNYEENEIKQAWDKFYGDKKKKFTNNLLPVEFFNRSCFKKNGKPIPTDAEAKEFRKEELIDECFPRWQEELPGLEKRRVYLIDDDYDTTEKVKQLGFSAIHFPTITSTRPVGTTFTKEGSEAFIALHKLIDTAVPDGQIIADEDSSSSMENYDCLLC